MAAEVMDYNCSTLFRTPYFQCVRHHDLLAPSVSERRDITAAMEPHPHSSGSTRSQPTSAKPQTTDPTASETNRTSPVLFTSLEELFGWLGATAGDCLEVNQVSIDNFRAIEKRRDTEGRKFRFLYERGTTILIITIPTRPHEVMHRWLDSRVGIKAYAMGLVDQLDPTGATTYENIVGGGLETSLEGDSSQTPSLRTPPHRWPALVIEAGCSQTVGQLRMRARAWFLSSNFQVKIVILAKMLVSERRIVLEKWKGVRAGDRTGSLRTRSESRRTPECVQTIEISRPDAGEEPPSVSPESYRVTSGALRLEFEELFLRPPAGGEADIIIAEEELQLYASKVWAAAG